MLVGHQEDHDNLCSESGQLRAKLIALPVTRLLATQPAMRVAQSFRRSINLLTDSGGIVSVTLPEIDPGPFSIVVGAIGPKGLSLQVEYGGFQRQPRVAYDGKQLCIGQLSVDLSCAKRWNPALDQGQLRTVELNAALGQIYDLLSRYAPKDSLVFEFSIDSLSTAATRMRKAWARIRQAIELADPEMCKRAGELAAGVGIGLTPAGDDFLIGVLLAMWLRMDNPAAYMDSLLAGTVDRTGLLSAALLQAAGRGEAGKAWHNLARSMVQRDAEQTLAATKVLLNAGHTSGSDALFGLIMTLVTIDPERARGATVARFQTSE